MIDSEYDLGNVFYILNDTVVPTSIILRKLLELLIKEIGKLDKNKIIDITGEFTPISTIKEKNIEGKGRNKYATRYLIFPTANILTSKSNFSIKFNGFTVTFKDLYDAIK